MGSERSKCVEVFYEVEVKYLFEIDYYNCKIHFANLMRTAEEKLLADIERING